MVNDDTVQQHSTPAPSGGPSSGDASRPDAPSSSPYEKLDGGGWSRSEGPGDRWQRLQSLVNQLPGAVYRCTYDASWTSIFMGRGFRDICGIDPRSLDPAGRSFKEVIFDEDIPRIKAAVQAAVADRTYYSIEYRVETDAGSMKWLEDNGRPFFEDDGSVKWLDGILLDITERKRVRESLQRMTDTLEETVEMRTEQVRALAAELSMVEQNERSQIARTLHDEIQQFLYGVQIQTKMLLNDIQKRKDIDTEDLTVTPQDVDELLQQAIQTTRGLTVDLAPPVLDSDGLRESLQWLRSHLRETRGLTVNLSADIIQFDVPAEIRLVLFQAVRECLGNVCSHADVDTAQVALTETPERVVVTIVDEGCGFDVDATLGQDKAGFGLRTAAERLRLLGADLLIESAPGDGTTCTISFPKEKMSDIQTLSTEHNLTAPTGSESNPPPDGTVPIK